MAAVDRVIRIDLEGDKHPEYLIAATTPRKGYWEGEISPRDYALVLLLKEVKGKAQVMPVITTFFKKPKKDDLSRQHLVGTVLDIDGDGVQEIIVETQGSEWGETRVFRAGETGVRQVLYADWDE